MGGRSAVHRLALIGKKVIHKADDLFQVLLGQAVVEGQTHQALALFGGVHILTGKASELQARRRLPR